MHLSAGFSGLCMREYLERVSADEEADTSDRRRVRKKQEVKEREASGFCKSDLGNVPTSQEEQINETDFYL